MADFAKINGVAAADISKINGQADFAKLCGSTKPASGASLWVAAGNDRVIAYITNADLLAGNDWSSYDAFSGAQSQPYNSASVDHINVAFGKDGINGNPFWVSTWESDNPELATHDDATSGPWTGINTDQAGNALSMRRFAIEWGNGVWVAVGKMGNSTKYIFRSTNGADWEQVDISGASGITTEGIYTIRTNGSGTWWLAQNNRIYQSTDNAQSFSLLHTLLDSGGGNPGKIRSMVYTNNTLLVGIMNTGEFFTASTSDLTDWSTETTLSNHHGVCFDNQSRIAAAAGRVVVVGGQFKSTFDINGKSVTMDENGVDFSGDNTQHGNLFGVATDGSTWVACCSTGDMFYSTNGGDSWTASTTNVGSEDMMHIAANVALPL